MRPWTLFLLIGFISCKKESDQINIYANNDNVRSVENFERTFENLTNNDGFVGIISVHIDAQSSTKGAEIRVESNNIIYTPPKDFVGIDKFDYKICSTRDSSVCSSATVTVEVLKAYRLDVPSSLETYYQNLFLCEDFQTNQQVLGKLTSNSHTSILSYGQRHDFIYSADADLQNPNNVVLMYSSERRFWKEYTSPNNDHNPQTFNTEHVYPQSKLENDDAVTDLHHLRVCDSKINSSRSNHPFVDGEGSFERVNTTWFPGDEWKGDVARMIFYLNIRYNEIINDVGTLELFIKWNIEDPVSDFERQRNSVIERAQGDRNPFIDNPYLVTLLWGGEDAENLWE